MPSIINSDDGVVSGTSGLKTTGGNDGVLNIQTNGTNAISISSGQRSTFPTTIGVGGATPSTSGSGITFPATQSASSDANTLDDYEEGTWTPKTGTNITVEAATYTKIGNRVTITGTVIHSGAITSYDRIALPFAPVAATSETRYTGGVQFFEGGTGTAAVNIRLLTQQNVSPDSFFWGNSGSELWPFSMAYDGTNGVKQYTFEMTYRV